MHGRSMMFLAAALSAAIAPGLMAVEAIPPMPDDTRRGEGKKSREGRTFRTEKRPEPQRKKRSSSLDRMLKRARR